MNVSKACDMHAKYVKRLRHPQTDFEGYEMSSHFASLLGSHARLMAELNSGSPLSNMSIAVHCMCQPHVVQYIRVVPWPRKSLEFSLRISFARLVIFHVFCVVYTYTTSDFLC